MGPAISPPACRAAYAPFTPNESGQRSPPTYYRGCWHVVSRGFFCGYRRGSPPLKAVYGPKAFVPHAASLRQAFAHCAIFPTAASRRSLGRVSVPMRPSRLSPRLPVASAVGRHPAACLMGRGPIPLREKLCPPGHAAPRGHRALPRVSPGYSRQGGRSPTRYSPVRRFIRRPKAAFSARLACVRRAASVRPEPGSNSPSKGALGPGHLKKTMMWFF